MGEDEPASRLFIGLGEVVYGRFLAFSLRGKPIRYFAIKEICFMVSFLADSVLTF